MRGNIFILGYSRAGKTTLARGVAGGLGWVHVGASAWAREGFARDVLLAPGEDFVAAITAYSARRLREDPDACVSDLRARYPLAAGGHVIEGIRNPRDFLHLFDPRADKVIHLENALVPGPATRFEEGVGLIARYLDWLTAGGLAAEVQHTERVAAYEALPGAVAGALAWLRGAGGV